jgi:hypothetical protein
MKLYAFAALLALPLLGLGAGGASADYYCCGKEKTQHYTQYAYLHTDAQVFGCDGYHCQTEVKVYSGTKVKVFCRNGWCQIKNFPFDNAWVLESCLKIEHHGYKKDDVYQGEEGEGYEEPRHYRKHRGYGHPKY